MRILILDPIRVVNKDGCSIHRIELIRNFCALHHHIYILVKGRKDGNLNDILNNSLIHIKYVNSRKIIYVFSYLFNLCSHAFNEKIDVYYTRNAIFCGFGIILKKINKSILIFEKNGISSDESDLFDNFRSKGNLSGKQKQKINSRRFFESLELFFLKYCDVVVAVTPLIKNYLIDNGINEEKIYVIENGANTDMFKPAEKHIVRGEVGLDQKVQYVCFVGNFAPWQGLEYLVQAAPLVIKRIPVIFLIIGDGIIRKQLENMVEELGLEHNFVFTGLLPYEIVPKYIESSDLCVAPFIRARNEKIGLSPLKIYEYMACGKAVIASDIPGVNDLLQNSGGGIVVTPEQPSELAESIINLLQNDELMNRMGENGRKYVVENNSWASVVKKIVTISENVMR